MLLDAEKQTVEVPTDKLFEQRKKLEDALLLEKISLKALQSLIGSLNFLCRAIAPGRAFSRRLIGATRGLAHPREVTRVTLSMKEDLKMWLEFLAKFNGVSLFRDPIWESNADVEFFTDAAASIGLGIYVQGNWAHAKWGNHFPVETAANNITFLELFPIVAAVHMFGELIRNKKVLFHCDNMAVCEIMNSQSSRCPRIMDLVRPLVLACLELNVTFKVQHLAGCKNSIADALSRFQMDVFYRVAPRAAPSSTPIPEHLWLL